MEIYTRTLHEALSAELLMILLFLLYALLATYRTYYSEGKTSAIRMLLSGLAERPVSKTSHALSTFFTYLIFSFTLVIYLTSLYTHIFGTKIQPTEILFLGCAVMLLIGLLRFIKRMLALVMNIEKLQNAAIGQRTLKRFYLIPLIMLFWASIEYFLSHSDILLYINFSLFLILLFILEVGVISRYRRELTGRWLYLLLYLCALEIAPYLLIFKLTMQ